MEYKLYKGYILGPGEKNPAYDIYEVNIYLHKEDVGIENIWHTSENEWEAQLWLDRGELDLLRAMGPATQADVDELNKSATPKYPNYIMQKVRQRLGIEENDTSRDADINNMSKDEVFQHCLY
jgi:hypothetical protein